MIRPVPPRRRPPRPVPPRLPSLRPAPPVACSGFGFDRYHAKHVREYLLPDILGMKRVLRDKRRRSTSQHPQTKSGPGPADKPRINRSSTARQPLIVFLDPVYIGFNTFVPPKRLPRRLSSPVLETGTYRFLVVQIGLAPPRPVRTLRPGRPPLIDTTCAASPLLLASLRPAPPVACPRFGFDRL